MTTNIRYTRQVRLAEVGEAGQGRLSRAHARVPERGLAADVEARYLSAAGVTVERGGAAEHAVPSWLVSLHPAASEVARGTHGALSVLRGVLSSTPHPRVVSES